MSASDTGPLSGARVASLSSRLVRTAGLLELSDVRLEIGVGADSVRLAPSIVSIALQIRLPVSHTPSCLIHALVQSLRSTVFHTLLVSSCF